jgi:hypothetical protein
LETKSSSSQIKNIVESHFRRLEQVEDRVLGLKDKTDIKENMGEYIDERLKSCEKNIQELCNCIKTPNLQIMRIEREVQAKDISNIFKKIIENVPNLKKVVPT